MASLPETPARPSPAPETVTVGVVTRTRDRALFVVRALASVLGQTHPHWQIALVNDGGDPQALRAAIAGAGLSARLAGRLTILDNPTSCGRAAAFNQGLRALDTEFVACLDDDDSWDPEFLSALLALHAHNAPLIPDLGGMAAGVTALREDVATGADGLPAIQPMGEDQLPNAFHRGDFLIGPIAYATYRHDLYPVQWLLRRDAVLATGGFPEAFEVMEDRAFMVRFLQDWRIATLDRPLAFHHRRVRRTQDTARTAEMNTLDNPSYDWRRFSDLALPPLTAGPDGADLPRLVRAVGTSVVRELNDETSALWHKLNGEMGDLRSRLDHLLQTSSGARPTALPAAEAPLWSLWPAVGPVQIGYRLAPATPFLDRFELSLAGDPAGLLLHADPHSRRFELQIPQTGDWCALELSLDGLAPRGRAITCGMVVGITGGGLFETALITVARTGLGRARPQVTEVQVHRADPGMTLHRSIPAGSGVAKLSLVLPRHATNLRLCLHDLVVTADHDPAQPATRD